MKKIGVINKHQIFNINNNIFNPSIYTIGENLEYPLLKLRSLFQEANIEMCTLDQAPIDDFDGIIFLDYPARSDRKILHEFKKKKLFLITLESPIVCRKNLSIHKTKIFDKVFTWNKKFNTEKTVHIKLPNKVPEKILFDQNQKRKLCTMIAQNKQTNIPKELYSERKFALEWFEKNAPFDFDLYGIGWEEKNISYPFYIISKISYLKKKIPTTYKTYKGKVDKKIKTLSNYKFSICYENIYGWDTYITEKIFDCFFAGTIPIYLGTPNISKYIPKEAFIDKNEFPTYKQLYEYIKYMDEKTYFQYIDAIKYFVEELYCQDFNADIFADIVCSQIKSLL